MGLIYLLFFFSGFSALTLQVAWTKILGQTIGIDYFSQIVVVSVFMIGLGFGGLLGLYLSRKSRRPAIVFAFAEMAIATFAIFSPFLLREAQGGSIWLAGHIFGGRYLASDFFIYLAILIWPVMLMGATLPIVVRVLESSGERAGALVGRIYAINILGAIVGTLVSGIVLLGVLGISGTIYTAAIINLVLSVLVAWGLRHRTIDPIDGTSASGFRGNIWMLVAFVVGFISIGYEMLFFRSSGYYFGATSYVFPIALASFLAWLFIGTRASGLFIKNGISPRTVLSASLLLTVVSTILPLALPHLLQTFCGDSFMVITELKETARLPDFLGMAGVIFASMLPVGLFRVASRR